MGLIDVRFYPQGKHIDYSTLPPLQTKNSNWTVPICQHKTIIAAGPKTSHWTFIMLDLTGLNSLTQWQPTESVLVKSNIDCTQTAVKLTSIYSKRSNKFNQTNSFKANEIVIIKHWLPGLWSSEQVRNNLGSSNICRSFRNVCFSLLWVLNGLGLI